MRYSKLIPRTGVRTITDALLPSLEQISIMREVFSSVSCFGFVFTIYATSHPDKKMAPTSLQKKKYPTHNINVVG